MKTKTIILGIFVAIISTFTFNNSNAQRLDEPAIKVVPASEKDAVKVIYGYHANDVVEVKFLSNNTTLKVDKIKAKDFEDGFMRTYSLKNLDQDDLRIEVSGSEVSATYQLKNINGRWIAQLEKSSYNYPIVALK